MDEYEYKLTLFWTNELCPKFIASMIFVTQIFLYINQITTLLFIRIIF